MVCSYLCIYLPSLLSSLGLSGQTAEAQYSAHWPGTILLFAIAANQIQNNQKRNQ